jgi:ABC-type transporter Mla maintaining outer membrane lipid asymmetry ATPase subunit MlaF
VSSSLVEFSGVSKGYGGLRPLRVASLTVSDGDSVALLGFDRPGAEVFVNLATGATLPDAGEVRLFGRPTSAITDSADWLTTLDRFGIVSERAVLLDNMTVIQNLAMPFTLAIEPPPEEERGLAGALANEVGLPPAVWNEPLVRLDVAAAMRVRLGRALALGPAVLVLEHASAPLPPDAALAFAATIQTVAARRQLAVVALSADERFASALGATLLVHEPASGRLKPPARRWFGARRG